MSSGSQVLEISVRFDGRSAFTDMVALPAPAWIDDVGVIIDGRIDNLPEVCRALGISESAGLYTALVQGFRVWQTSLPRRLAGDFALVFFDRRHGQLVVSRDPFGVRPLFYKAKGRTLSVSNRIVRLVGPDEPLDDQRIVEYLIKRYDPPGRTFFSNVREVPPGGTLVAGPHSLAESTYWEPQASHLPRIKDQREFESQFRQLFLQAVVRRLDPERPVVIHVSGGLDSSGIACAADIASRSSEATRFDLIGAAAVYPGMACDESRYIDSVAAHVGFPIVRWDDTSPDVGDIFDPHPDGPGLRNLFRGGSAGDLRLARESNARVLLSGIGGDNLGIVEGYVADLIAAGHWRGAFAELVSFPGATVRTRIERVRRLLRQFVPDPFDGYLRRRRKPVPTWLAPYAREIARSLNRARPALPTDLTNLQRSLWRRLVAPETLRNISMMNTAASSQGCEYRFPYLDKDLVLFAMAAPLEFWPRPGAFVRLHRDPLAQILPASIATRFGKAEFTPAVARKVQVVGTVALKAFGNRWVSGRYIDTDAARQFCWSLISSGTIHDHRFVDVWAILTLEAWLRRQEGLTFPGHDRGTRRELGTS